MAESSINSRWIIVLSKKWGGDLLNLVPTPAQLWFPFKGWPFHQITDTKVKWLICCHCPRRDNNLFDAFPDGSKIASDDQHAYNYLISERSNSDSSIFLNTALTCFFNLQRPGPAADITNRQLLNNMNAYYIISSGPGMIQKLSKVRTHGLSSGHLSLDHCPKPVQNALELLACPEASVISEGQIHLSQ